MTAVLEITGSLTMLIVNTSKTGSTKTNSGEFAREEGRAGMKREDESSLLLAHLN